MALFGAASEADGTVAALTNVHAVMKDAITKDNIIGVVKVLGRISIHAKGVYAFSYPFRVSIFMYSNQIRQRISPNETTVWPTFPVFFFTHMSLSWIPSLPLLLHRNRSFFLVYPFIPFVISPHSS